MDEETKKLLVKDIDAAKLLVGQAQKRIHSFLSRPIHMQLFQKLGRIFSELDELIDSITEGDYD